MKSIIVWILAILPFAGFSQRDSVNCHVEIQDIWDLDYIKSTVKVDFFIVIAKYSSQINKELTLLNGTILNVDTIVDNVKSNYLTLRIVAEIRNKFNFDNYPLDEQTISIKFEPFQYYDNVVLYSNSDQNILVGEVSLNGWQVGKIRFRHSVEEYVINDSNEKQIYSYSNATFEVPLKRNNRFLYFLKFFLPSLISILIIYVGFILPYNQLESKLNLAVGSLFVMISNFIGNQQQIPNISIITIIEKINILSLLIIFLTIVVFTVNFTFHKRIKPKNWNRINWSFVISTMIIFFTYLLIII